MARRLYLAEVNLIRINQTQLVTGIVAAVAAWFIINRVLPKLTTDQAPETQLTDTEENS